MASCCHKQQNSTLLLRPNILFYLFIIMGWCEAGMVKWRSGAQDMSRWLEAPLLSGAALCPTVDAMAWPPSCPVRPVQHRWPPGKLFPWKDMLCGLSFNHISLMTWKHSLPWPTSTCLGSRKGWRLCGHWGRQGWGWAWPSH